MSGTIYVGQGVTAGILQGIFMAASCNGNHILPARVNSFRAIAGYGKASYNPAVAGCRGVYYNDGIGERSIVVDSEPEQGEGFQVA